MVVGLLGGGGDTRGIAVSLVETARKQQTGFTLKVRAARIHYECKTISQTILQKTRFHLKILFAINNNYPVKIIH